MAVPFSYLNSKADRRQIGTFWTPSDCEPQNDRIIELKVEVESRVIAIKTNIILMIRSKTREYLKKVLRKGYYFLPVRVRNYCEKHRIKFKKHARHKLALTTFGTLLSYPRSGNHWLRFIIEYISSSPTLGHLGDINDISIHQNEFTDNTILRHVAGKPILLKAHNTHKIPKPQKPIIFILRHPYDAIPRHAFLRLSNNDTTPLEEHVKSYMSLIDFVEAHKGQVSIVMYDDLVKNPASVARCVFKFLQIENDHYLRKFETNHTELAELSKTGKKRVWGGVNYKNKTVDADIKAKIIHLIDQYDSWQKYFKQPMNNHESCIKI